MPLRMRDISAYQGTDVEKFEHADVIGIKATEGTGYISPNFQADWRHTKEAGKARVAYHMLHPSISAKAQVRYFLDTVMNAEVETGDMICVDHENTDGLAPVDVAACALEFVQECDAETKAKTIVYTYLNFPALGNCAGLGRQPLWIADPGRPPGNPKIPEPWESWLMHQYAITKGTDDDLVNVDSLESLLQYGVLVSDPGPAENQRMLYLTDGKVEKQIIVEETNLVSGFHMEAGTAFFKVM